LPTVFSCEFRIKNHLYDKQVSKLQFDHKHVEYWNEFFGRFFCRPEEPHDKAKIIAEMLEQQQI
jgi:hypothetical protein